MSPTSARLFMRKVLEINLQYGLCKILLLIYYNQLKTHFVIDQNWIFTAISSIWYLYNLEFFVKLILRFIDP